MFVKEKHLDILNSISFLNYANLTILSGNLCLSVCLWFNYLENRALYEVEADSVYCSVRTQVRAISRKIIWMSGLQQIIIIICQKQNNKTL